MLISASAVLAELPPGRVSAPNNQHQEMATRRHGRQSRQSVTVPIISSASAARIAGPGYYEVK